MSSNNVTKARDSQEKPNKADSAQGMDTLDLVGDLDLEELEKAVLEAEKLQGRAKYDRLNELHAQMVDIYALSQENDIKSWYEHVKAPPGAYPQADDIRAVSQRQSTRALAWSSLVTASVMLLLAVSLAIWCFLPAIVEVISPATSRNDNATCSMQSPLSHGCDTDGDLTKSHKQTCLADSLFLARTRSMDGTDLDPDVNYPARNSSLSVSHLAWIKHADDNIFRARMRLERCIGYMVIEKRISDADADTDAEKRLCLGRLQAVGQDVFSTWPLLVEYGQQVETGAAQVTAWVEQVERRHSRQKRSIGQRMLLGRGDGDSDEEGKQLHPQLFMSLHRSQEFSVKFLSLHHEMVHVIHPLLTGLRFAGKKIQAGKDVCSEAEWESIVLIFDLAVEEVARAAWLLTHAGLVENRVQALVGSATDWYGEMEDAHMPKMREVRKEMQKLRDVWLRQ